MSSLLANRGVFVGEISSGVSTIISRILISALPIGGRTQREPINETDEITSNDDFECTEIIGLRGTAFASFSNT